MEQFNISRIKRREAVKEEKGNIRTLLPVGMNPNEQVKTESAFLPLLLGFNVCGLC